MKNLSISDFRRRTDPLTDQEMDFASLGIAPDNQLGFFNPLRLSELVVFCEKNPEFHVISYLKHHRVRVNTVVNTAAFFRLGQGEKDPALMCIPRISKDVFDLLRIFKFDTD